MKTDQGDVLLYQTANDGDIVAENGVIELTGDLRTAVYVSLFGGQVDWWGDISTTDPDFKNTSETNELLDSIAAIPANLLRIEDAAKRDLEWLKSKKIASSVQVSASMPGINAVRLQINISASGDESSFEFTENWKAFV